MLDDGKVRVHPPIKRVFDDLVSKLEAAGHEIVEWDTALNEECIAIMVSPPKMATYNFPNCTRTSITEQMEAKISARPLQKVVSLFYLTSKLSSTVRLRYLCTNTGS